MNAPRHHIALLLALLAASPVVVACKKAPEASNAPLPTQSQSLDGGVSVDASVVRAPLVAAADAGPPTEFSGTIRGVVKLAKGAKLPLGPFPQQNGVTPPTAPGCPPIDSSDQRVVTLAKQTGGLSPVHVALTGMRAVEPREPLTQELFVDACRLRPSLVGALRGDMVRVTNRSEAALVPRLPGASFMRGLMRGDDQQAKLTQAQTNVECAFGAYCGQALVIATTHTLYAVTTAEGFFTIERVPLDQPLQVHAWNPLFELVSEGFTLTHERPEQMIELTLTPTAIAAKTKPGAPKPTAPPPVLFDRTDAGIIMRPGARGPGYE